MSNEKRSTEKLHEKIGEEIKELATREAGDDICSLKSVMDRYEETRGCCRS